MMSYVFFAQFGVHNFLLLNNNKTKSNVSMRTNIGLPYFFVDIVEKKNIDIMNHEKYAPHETK